jgi:hypothetical protein
MPLPGGGAGRAGMGWNSPQPPPGGGGPGCMGEMSPCLTASAAALARAMDSATVAGKLVGWCAGTTMGSWGAPKPMALCAGVLVGVIVFSSSVWIKDFAIVSCSIVPVSRTLQRSPDLSISMRAPLCSWNARMREPCAPMSAPEALFGRSMYSEASSSFAWQW